VRGENGSLGTATHINFGSLRLPRVTQHFFHPLPPANFAPKLCQIRNTSLIHMIRTEAVRMDHARVPHLFL
jgi:hypothetical protein